MLATGRGSIAQIHYTGEEAAGEINKLLSAVVSPALSRWIADWC
jgi:pre-mRNA-processing factor 39